MDFCLGAVVGLVAITPASGFVPVPVSIFIGVVGGTTSIFASKAVDAAATDGLAYGGTALFLKHLLTLVVVSAFVFVASFALLKITDLITPLRVSEEEELQGLDVSQHEEKLLVNA